MEACPKLLAPFADPLSSAKIPFQTRGGQADCKSARGELGRLRLQRSHWNCGRGWPYLARCVGARFHDCGGRDDRTVGICVPTASTRRGIRPPYAELISKQCAVAPENDLVPAEYSCEKR